jgi:nucleoside-diphosphate-sugar epimerase
MTVAVFGATGKTGKHLVPALLEAGHDVLALGRDPARLAALDARATTAEADLLRPAGLAEILADCETVVSLAHARFAEVILAALPPGCRRVILTGSVRRFTTLPDPAADAVRRAESAFAESGRPGVMLHPSMIYGTAEERNVNRILDRLEAWPRGLPLVVPLPDGGRHLVQPVYYEDVVAAFVAAVDRPEATGAPIVLAGPEPMRYADMVRACAAAYGRTALVPPLPTAVLVGTARLTAALGLTPPFSPAEIRRAAEDKSFDVAAMKTRLGVTPRPFAEGLERVMARRRRGLAAAAASGHDGP